MQDILGSPFPNYYRLYPWLPKMRHLLGYLTYTAKVLPSIRRQTPFLISPPDEPAPNSIPVATLMQPLKPSIQKALNTSLSESDLLTVLATLNTQRPIPTMFNRIKIRPTNLLEFLFAAIYILTPSPRFQYKTYKEGQQTTEELLLQAGVEYVRVLQDNKIRQLKTKIPLETRAPNITITFTIDTSHLEMARKLALLYLLAQILEPDTKSDGATMNSLLLEAITIITGTRTASPKIQDLANNIYQILSQQESSPLTTLKNLINFTQQTAKVDIFTHPDQLLQLLQTFNLDWLLKIAIHIALTLNDDDSFLPPLKTDPRELPLAE